MKRCESLLIIIFLNFLEIKVVLGKNIFPNLILDKYLQLCFPKAFFRLNCQEVEFEPPTPSPDFHKNLMALILYIQGAPGLAINLSGGDREHL